MADSGYKTPSNAILVAGTPLEQTLKVENATNMYPGRLVKKGTNDDDIVVNTAAGNAVGWLGYEQTTKKHRPATVDTIYLINAQAVILNGGGFVIVARLASGESVAKGAPLVDAANGELKAASAGTVTIASGSTTVLSDKAQPDEAVVGSYGDQGPVKAYAEETVDASGGAKDIMVRSLI